MGFERKIRTVSALTAAGAIVAFATACGSSNNAEPAPTDASTSASASPSAGSEAYTALGQWNVTESMKDSNDINAIAKTLDVSPDRVAAGVVGSAACNPAITFAQIESGIKITTMTVDGVTFGPCTPSDLVTTNGKPPQAGEIWTAIQGMACAQPATAS